MTFFTTMDPMMAWLIIGAILMLLELIIPGVYLFWLGAAALAVGGLLSIFSLAFTVQMILFAIFAVIALVIGVKVYKGKDRDIESHHLNQIRGAEYIGKTYTLTMDITNNNGRLPLGDSVWNIQGENLPMGTQIRITKVVGNTLHYDKAE
ncbi:NfeD family protein [Ignatzschineria rhizosphaerae]|uniref:NfeD family protein n=1 Tax=Ignatzschineria rhizosphaerae TaxID=2923279 RepID=A0ABY3WXZ3_9GAMM|nr:NfeD family protein [Ignatzschineria rhizosphaerae]UNM95484.1 NfeD family protein [Ignatzschineria rhizosphaerae]